MKRYKILVIGEQNEDLFIYTKKRLSHESDSFIITEVSRQSNPGMAANTVANFQSLTDNNIDLYFFTNEEKITKTRFVGEFGSQLLRFDENDKVQNKTYEDFVIWQEIKMGFSIRSLDAVVVSSYNKGLVDEDFIYCLSGACNYFGVPLFVDCKFILGEWSKLVTFCKINYHEYQLQLTKLSNPEQFTRNLIVTLGEDGSWWVNKNITIPVEKVKVSNTSGSGDTHLASYVLSYLKFNHLEFDERVKKSMQYANKAASIAVQHPGVIAVDGKLVW